VNTDEAYRLSSKVWAELIVALEQQTLEGCKHRIKEAFKHLNSLRHSLHQQTKADK
jgi:hypothetical protein